MVLGTGFDKFWEGENHGFGLTPPSFRWFSPVLELSRRSAGCFNPQSVGRQHATE